MGENVKQKQILRALACLALPVIMAAYLVYKASKDGVDFEVYWAGAREFVTGGNLYAAGLQGTSFDAMAFTYPPFAALVLAPMALLPLEVAKGIQALSNLALGALLGMIVARYLMSVGVLRVSPHNRRWWLSAALITGLLLLLGPWRNSLSLGQINPLLMVLIVVDLLVTTRRRPNGLLPRGILTGIAAGIKLTPLVFLLYFVVRRDFRSAGRMLAGFAATVGLMALVAPSESLQYWFTALKDTTRVGELSRFDNVSLRGFIARLHLPSEAGNVLWIALSLLVIVLGALAVHRMRLQSDQWAAVGAAVLVMLLISPVSWSHHWVWVAVLVPALLGRFAAGSVSTFLWGRFFRSPAGILSILLVAGFALHPGESARLSGSADPYVSISAFSEVVVESGLLAGFLILAWLAFARESLLSAEASPFPGRAQSSGKSHVQAQSQAQGPVEVVLKGERS
jgi:alpha-1,2-mannosyltransferase